MLAHRMRRVDELVFLFHRLLLGLLSEGSMLPAG